MEVDRTDKRKRKTASQLEILENTYAVEPFPSQELIAELSAKLGLSDQQVKMWFHRRRLKDRRTTFEASTMAVGEAGREPVSGSPYSLQVVHRPGVRVPSYANEGLSTRQYDQLPWTVQQSRAVAAVEAQLGGPLREDGPILGFQFDPLPPGAFRTPIEPAVHCRPGGLSYRAERRDRPDGGPIKGANRTSLECQFTQGEPSSGAAAYRRHVPPRYYSSPAEAQGTWTGGSSYVHGTQLPTSGLLHPQGRQPHISRALGAHGVTQSSSRLNRRVDANFGGCSITEEENPLIPSETQVIHDDRLLERNWKSKDANVGRKVEAQEKRLIDELLEELDTLRQKKEDQTRKQDRGKQKQKSLLREQQCEERYPMELRELRPEIERREKFLLKESKRAEKMRLKEEMCQKKQAARLKTVKETLELIEDKQLELIELAYFIRALRSISTLASETLQKLRSFGDKCGEFPPKSVCLKKPFRAQPWIDSDKSVSTLLMVWRFLICFADALSLSPFTIDEFVQALHDTDSRLLGQVHIALLRSIIIDIEDAVNPGGGHPHIVEGAYAWDFNISSWQRHLNAVTWPEILRQFALSAGFGPELKKRSSELARPSDKNKGNDDTDTSSSSPNEVAAENAVAATVATMISVPWRSLHRLTPGTIKFAVFHVLLLEGIKGLRVQEIADKIQKSGLYNLSRSKKPVSTITSVLTTDTKLFERTARSTYRVCTLYGEDPADAKSLFDAAKERVRLLRNSFVKRKELNHGEISVPDKWVQRIMEGEYSDLSVEERLDALVALISVATEGNSIRIVLEERIEAASAMKKEMQTEAQLNMHRLEEQNVSKMQTSSESCEFDQNFSITAMEHSSSLAITGKYGVASSSFAAQPGDSNDDLQLLCLEYTADKSSPQINASIDHTAEETDICTPLQIGQDRRGNQYWQFKTSSSSNDPGSGRIFVHLCEGRWRLIDSEKDFDALLQSLDVCGVREPQLHSMLQQIEAAFKENVRMLQRNSDRDVGHHVRNKEMRPNLYVPNIDRSEASESFVIQLGRNVAENNDVLRRSLDFEKWMWDECLNSTLLSAVKWGERRRKKLLNVCDHCHALHLVKERHRHHCHTMSGASVKKPSPPVQIALLKAQLASMEDCIPKEAFESGWSKKHRKHWGLKLIGASSSKDLLQLILALLDGAIKKELLGASETCRDL